MKKVSNSLQVYMNGLRVGTLTQGSTTNLSFQYSPEWIDKHSDFAISLKMPVRENAYVGDIVYNYFDNLLPEAKDIRDIIAAKTRAKSSKTFDLLSTVGRDCIGALQFYNFETKPSPDLRIKGKLINEKQITQILRNLKKAPLGMDENSDFRISLTGAHEKTALQLKNNKWYIPIENSATTHIFKPSIGIINQSMDLRDSIENEWLCLQICKAFNLKIANAEIYEFDKTRVLVIERFDRRIIDGKIYRLPQEDFCQSLGFPAFKKYQSDGGPSIQQICSTLKFSSESISDRHDFLKAQIIYWLMAAIDGHAKNFSIHLQPGGFVLSPLYDVLSAEPLIIKGQLNKHEVKMAMKIGKPGHYRVKDIVGRHWLQMESTLEVPKGFVSQIIEEVINEFKNVRAISSQLKSSIPAYIVDSIFKGMEKRLNLLE